MFSVHYASKYAFAFESFAGILGGGFQHTRLWRLMVYSRDTTSAMAERLLPVLTLDISAVRLDELTRSELRETD